MGKIRKREYVNLLDLLKGPTSGVYEWPAAMPSDQRSRSLKFIPDIFWAASLPLELPKLEGPLSGLVVDLEGITPISLLVSFPHGVPYVYLPANLFLIVGTILSFGLFVCYFPPVFVQVQ